MNLRRILIGNPLRSEEAQHQAIGKVVALAVFASDALSSTAYATQEILIVLAAAAAISGTAVLGTSIPIAIAITILLAILTISYRQTIFSYPGGGGAYIVAHDNFGDRAAQIAGASLLVNYILTVSVSISSGVEQVASAFPALYPHRVTIAVIAIAGMTLINLRGVKESGSIFAVPTYFFIAVTMFTLLRGLFQWLTGTLNIVEDVEVLHYPASEQMQYGWFLILYAFSSGCSAITGVEAVSNGIPAFKEPRTKNAAATMIVMSSLLGTMFLGITFLANAVHAQPSEVETIISQVARAVHGSSVFYYLQLGGTAVILIMAANTAYADFPRVAALMAKDGFVPRQLAFKGSRLVFSWGIMALAIAAIILIIIFNAKTTLLIPLYAIGVFMGFTLSQFGMVRRWLRVSKFGADDEIVLAHTTMRFDPQWRIKAIINAVGGTLTFIVMCVFTYTKFTHGAWITAIVIPILVVLFIRIKKHYVDVARALSLSKRVVHPSKLPLHTVVFVDDVHMGTTHMVDFAMSLGSPWTAVHFEDNPEKSKIIQSKWQERMGEWDHPLIMHPAPFRKVSDTAAEYVRELQMEEPDTIIHVIMGQIIMHSWPSQALHANTSIGIKMALQNMKGVVVTDVPYQIRQEDVENAPPNEPSDYQVTTSVH
ncbi:MAG: APC family permease [Anaerolineae bacterium]|nr:APC family permease [Anaerolineae bacterium]